MGSIGASKAGAGGGTPEDRLLDSVGYDRDREYDKFDDTPRDGWEYRGDGRKQEKWMADNSNVDELISGMDAEDRSAFRDWTRGRFMSGQQYGGFDSMTSEDQEITRRMDAIIDRSTLDKGVVLSRRTTAELLLGKRDVSSLEELNALRGSTVVSKGAMSAGAAKEGLTIDSSGKPVELKIHIAGGTTGAAMWVGDNRINGWGSAQREMVVNRDSVFAIGRSTYDSKRDVYVTNLYYMGRQPHDYGKRGR